MHLEYSLKTVYIERYDASFKSHALSSVKYVADLYFLATMSLRSYSI